MTRACTGFAVYNPLFGPFWGHLAEVRGIIASTKESRLPAVLFQTSHRLVKLTPILRGQTMLRCRNHRISRIVVHSVRELNCIAEHGERLDYCKAETWDGCCGLLCRCAFMVSDISSARFQSLPMDLHPTLLTEIFQPARRVLNLLRASTRHRAFVAAGGKAWMPSAQK